ncbi:MAG TPA: gas vesicle protein GvpG [Gemmatimonadaceae bacterium]|nr:gas vesicle protein GvpG [Gemmatimonadaceae bacterium]
MGLLSKLLTFPVSGPVAGVKWSLEMVERTAREELTDDTPIKQDMMELQLALESGEIDDAQYLVREGKLMQRLRDVRYWREQFGMGVSGGPVRVQRDEDER